MKYVLITAAILIASGFIIANFTKATEAKIVEKKDDVAPSTKIVTGHPVTDLIINNAATEALNSISNRKG